MVLGEWLLLNVFVGIQPIAYFCPLMVQGPCAIYGGIPGALFHRRAEKKSCPHWTE